MTTRVTCTDPDGCHLLGRPVAHDETIEIDDEIAAVLDADVWKIAKPHKAKAEDTNDEKGKAE